MPARQSVWPATLSLSAHLAALGRAEFKFASRESDGGGRRAASSRLAVENQFVERSARIS